MFRHRVGVIVVLSLVVLGRAQSLAQLGTCGYEPSDRTFYPQPDPTDSLGYDGSGMMCSTSYLPCLSIAETIPVTRVVGPGTGSYAINSDGTLVNPADYVANEVVSQYAWLGIKIGPQSLGNIGTDLVVAFNGHALSGGTIHLNAFDSPHEYINWCIPVPIEYVRFAQRNSGSGSTPIPGQNHLTVTSSNPIATGICDDCSLDVGATTLSFNAMYPIVLVHGFNAGPWVWGPPNPTAGSCPASSQNASDAGQNFISGLSAIRAPFDCSIQINRQADIPAGADTLATNLPNVLQSFGVSHVNLVAHSKGGLWARQFLANNASQPEGSQIGVVSLTTLDTPHHGSVLSDAIVAWNTARLGLPVKAQIGYYLALANPLTRRKVENAFGAGNNDMTVGSVEQFNKGVCENPPSRFVAQGDASPFWTVPYYFSTSADADKNDDLHIDSSEASPYGQQQADVRYQMLGTSVSMPLTKDGNGHWVLNTTYPPSGTFIPNDTAVSVDSSRYPRFQEIGYWHGNSPPKDGRNHATIRNPDVAAPVLRWIIYAEASQPAALSTPSQPPE